MLGSITPVGVKPSRPASPPSWKPHTSTPNITDSDSRLSTEAFSGATTTAGHQEQHDERHQHDEHRRPAAAARPGCRGSRRARPGSRPRARATAAGSARTSATRPVGSSASRVAGGQDRQPRAAVRRGRTGPDRSALALRSRGRRRTPRPPSRPAATPPIRDSVRRVVGRRRSLRPGRGDHLNDVVPPRWRSRRGSCRTWRGSAATTEAPGRRASRSRSPTAGAPSRTRTRRPAPPASTGRRITRAAVRYQKPSSGARLTTPRRGSVRRPSSAQQRREHDHGADAPR